MSLGMIEDTPQNESAQNSFESRTLSADKLLNSREGPPQLTMGVLLAGVEKTSNPPKEK